MELYSPHSSSCRKARRTAVRRSGKSLRRNGARAAVPVEASRSGGFTLIELSIVLVVIGLIIGGILVGRDLVDSAELRKVVSEYQQYERAYNAFKLKYDCISCDYAQATALFGSQTSNDNGNGAIDQGLYETRHVCQHLSLAELVSSPCKGGFPNGGGTGVRPNVNALPTSYSSRSSGTYLMEMGWLQQDTNYYKHIPTGNYLCLGSSITGNGGAYHSAGVFNNCGQSGCAMAASDAKVIDQKIDDGAPYSGKLLQLAHGCADVVHNIYYNDSPTECQSYLSLQ